jgi:hypothetical protein
MMLAGRTNDGLCAMSLAATAVALISKQEPLLTAVHWLCASLHDRAQLHKCSSLLLLEG